MTRRSKLFRLDLRDFLKGLATAVFSSVAGVCLESLNNGSVVINKSTIGMAAAVGGIGYLKANFLSNDAGELFKKNIE